MSADTSSRSDGRPLQPILRWLNRAERFVLIGLLAALVAVITLQVFSRFVLKLPVAWSEEISRFLFIWFCWVGASYATHEYLHIRITAQFLVLPPVLRAMIVRLGDIVWIAFNLFALYASWMFLESIVQYPYLAMITEISMFWIFMPVAVFLAIFTFRLVVNLFDPDHVERTVHGNAELSVVRDLEIEVPGGETESSASPRNARK